MVAVGDTVIVAPMNGQKDYIAVITGPAGQTGSAGISGIMEGDYNTWTHKWVEKPTSDFNSTDDLDVLIDEVNNVISIGFHDGAAKNRFGVYNISDFSVVYESAAGDDYTNGYPTTAGKKGIHHNLAYLYNGAISRSLQTYLLLLRADYDTIEVWRGGAAALWSQSTAADFTRAVWCDVGAISLTGKYVLVVVQDEASPYDIYLMLYEGFDAGTSTTVTETVITDTSKAWAVDNLIGHIVHITSGGANGQQGTITSNTGITITCSAATFVTWGMSVGDTYKIS